MKITWIVLSVVTMISHSSCRKEQPAFIFETSDLEIRLMESNQPVFTYRIEPKSNGKGSSFNHYIHPLSGLNGETLTREFPEDHPHHRGVFWAWHQLYLGDQEIGDSWVMRNFDQEVRSADEHTDKNQAKITTVVLWNSELTENKDPFLEEHTEITVHKLQDHIRKIDFEIKLRALIDGVSIGGSDDEKGYGGFCVRLDCPDDLEFTSANGTITPRNLQINSGGWMDFSGTYDTISGISGIAIFCHPDTPNYPAPWIIRQTNSMQNIVFPGRARVGLSRDTPLVLRYRLIIHNGNARDADLETLHSAYCHESFVD